MSASGYVYMTPELKAEVETHWPKDGDIDMASGVVDKDRLKDEAELFFRSRREFTNFFQLKECANHFALRWGFAVSTYGGTQLVCCYSNCDQRNYVSKVPSPLKRGRQASIKDTKCTFVIRSSEGKRSRDTRGIVSKEDRAVKITSVVLSHSELCNPSADTQAIAKRVAGVYSAAIPLDKMMDILDVVEAGGNTNSIRTLLRKYLPPRYALTAADVWNFKTRALQLRLKSGTVIHQKDVEELLQFKGLDADFSIEIGRDIAAQSAKEILRTALQDTNMSWKVEGYLRSLKVADPYFDYRIARDERGAPTSKIIRVL
jgi:hypothetical protein